MFLSSSAKTFFFSNTPFNMSSILNIVSCSLCIKKERVLLAECVAIIFMLHKFRSYITFQLSHAMCLSCLVVSNLSSAHQVWTYCSTLSVGFKEPIRGCSSREAIIYIYIESPSIHIHS